MKLNFFRAIEVISDLGSLNAIAMKIILGSYRAHVDKVL